MRRPIRRCSFRSLTRAHEAYENNNRESESYTHYEYKTLVEVFLLFFLSSMEWRIHLQNYIRVIGDVFWYTHRQILRDLADFDNPGPRRGQLVAVTVFNAVGKVGNRVSVVDRQSALPLYVREPP